MKQNKKILKYTVMTIFCLSVVAAFVTIVVNFITGYTSSTFQIIKFISLAAWLITWGALRLLKSE